MQACANLSTMYSDVPLPERFALAASAGFKLAEMQYPYALSAIEIGAFLQQHGLQLRLINAPLGEQPDLRGLACRSDQKIAFRQQFLHGLGYASQLGCRFMHVLSGVLHAHEDRSTATACWIDNLAWAADMAAHKNIVLVVEALNPRDVPFYFLRSLQEAVELIDHIGSKHLRLLFDTYHAASSGLDCSRSFEEVASWSAHVQLADSPGRNAPGTGNIDWPEFFRTLARNAYAGDIGCEYLSTQKTDPGLRWFRELCQPA